MPTTDTFFARQARKLMRRPKSTCLTATTLEDRVVPTVSGFVFQDYNANGAFDTTGTIPNLGGTNTNGNKTAPLTIQTAIDTPVGGVTVRLFDAAGTLVDTVTTAAITGKWSSNVPTGTNPYRVEFSGFPAEYSAGPHGKTSGTATQFVVNGADQVNLGIVRTADYSSNTPILVTPIYNYGASNSTTEPALISFGYNAGNGTLDNTGGADANLPSFHDLAIPNNQVGSTWGVSFNRQQQTVYASAFTKRHVGWGPGGPGAIYRMNAPTQTAGATPSVTSATTWVNLQGATASYNGGTLALDVIGATFATWASDRQAPANQNQAFFELDGENTGWNAVGRTSLGGMDISDDGRFVYVMNLAQRVLVEIPVNANGTANTAAIRAFDIPTITGVADQDDVRPFAVEYQAGNIYVGLVQTGESSQNRADLRGFVYRFNPATGTFGTTSVVNDGTVIRNNGVASTTTDGFRLDYDRGNGYGGQEEFLPWRATFATIAAATDGTGASVGAPRAAKYPQAMLSSITFDNNNNIILSLRDRVGDQIGSSIPSNPTIAGAQPGQPGNLFYEGIPVGDTLMAFNNIIGSTTAGWQLERNGSSPVAANPATGITRTENLFGTNTTWGPNNAEGPYANPNAATTGTTGANPGGEFFGSDLFGASHDDTSLGAATHIPGFPDIVSAHFDAVIEGNVRTSGIRWLRTSNGDFTKAYQIYGQDSNLQGIGGRGQYGFTFGKANGQGDLIAVTEPPPVEIGNRIFRDNNRDGIQNADEPGIAGVQLELVAADGTTVIATVVTDANGTYYFNSGADPDTVNNPGNEAYGLAALLATGNYFVRIPNAAGGAQQAPLTGLIVTKFNTTTSAYIGDTDQQTRNSDAVLNGTNALITVAAGVIGENRHQWDAGFAPGVSLGNFVWNDANNNGVFDTGEQGINGIPVRLYSDANGDGTPDNPGTPDFTTTTANDGSSVPGFYLFNGLAPGKYVVEITSPAGFRSSTGTPFDPVNGAFESTLISSKANSNNNNEDHGYTVNGSIFSGFIIRTNTVTLTGPGGGNPDPDLGTGTANLRQDFGLYNTYSLGNRIFNDKNNNGTLDAGEAGINGVTVSLYRPSDFTNGNLNGGAVAIRTSTTGSNGYYRFDDLISGTYVVAVQGKAGPLANFVSSTGGTSLTTTFEPAANAIPAVSNVDSIDDGTTAAGNIVRTGVITLGPGATPIGEQDLVIPGDPTSQGNLDNQADMTVDLGFYQPLSLGNQIFNDANNNGVLDTGEVGIDGVSVSVFRSDGAGNPIGAALGTQSTQAGGFYLFTGLGTDNYVVRVNTTTLPTGYWLTSSGKNGSLTGPFEKAPDFSNPADSIDRGSVLNNTTVTSSVIGLSPGNAPAAGTQPNPPFVDTALPADSYRIVDFGFYQPVSLGNLVWNDLDNNGKFDSGTESGIGNIAVTLYFDSNANGEYDAAIDASVGNTTTNGSGFYLFQNLTPGGYFVEISAPGFTSSTGAAGQANGPYEPGITTNTDNEDHGTNKGAVIRSGLVTLTQGGNVGGPDIPGLIDPTPQANRNYTVDFGVYQSLQVGNLVWNDLNNNGLFDSATEQGIDGVFVELLNGAGTVLQSVNTAGGGLYLFSDLSAGQYSVRITTPAGFVSSTGTVGDPTGGPYEPGIGDNTNNADHGTNGTGANAKYTLAPQFTLFPAANVNNPDGGTANLRQDFGLFQPLSLGDFVWIDADNDGLFNNGESPMTGATVTLTDSKNAVVGVAQVTGADGKYLFNGLVPDTYTVTVTPAAGGYISSTGKNGSAVGPYQPGITANINNADHGTQSGANAVTTVTLLASGANPDSNGTANLNQDFGFFQPLRLGDFVWNDVNNNGVFDTGETKLNNVPVSLLLNGSIVGSTTTGVDGDYLFTNLIPGAYTVRITPPAGFTSSTGKNASTTGDYEPGITANINNVDHGSNNKALGTVDATVTLLAPGGNPDGGGLANLNQDFGLFVPLDLGSFVWIDSNNNGNFDKNEPALPNIPVRLLDGNGNVIATTTTNADGNYIFTNLAPGKYQVSITPPAGSLPSAVSTTPQASQDQQNVSIAGPNGTLVSPVVELTIGGGYLVGGNTSANSYVTFDFGVLALSQVSGYHFIDGNFDCVYTPGQNGDRPLAGVLVTITGVDANNQPLGTKSTTTDKNGFYQFTDLLPGTYTIVQTQPNGQLYTHCETPGTIDNKTVGSTPGTNKLVVPLQPNQTGINYNFGEVLPRMEFGYVWIDLNRNCTRDPGEGGLAGVPITISGTAYAGTDEARPLVASDLPGGTLTILTDATGYYAFPILPPGVYNVARGNLTPAQAAIYSDWCLQLGEPNPNPGTAGNNIFNNIPLTTPLIRGPYNFGVVPTNPNDPSKRDFLNNSGNNPTTGTNNTMPAPGGPTTGPVQYSPAFTVSTGTPTVATNVIMATGPGQRALVRVFDYGQQLEKFRFEPYGDYTGGVRVGQGDVNGDGVADFLTGTGSGGGPRVRVFDGKTGAQLKDFFAYEENFRNGIFVTAGDLNGDGKAEIITGTDAGGGPRITAFDGVTGERIRDYFAFDSSLRGGVRVAVGDFNGDGKTDIVATTGAGTATRVRIIDGQATSAAAPIRDFFAFGSTFTLGASLGTGDIDGDGVPDILVGTEAGGGPRVQIYSGANGTVLKDFFAYESNLRSGVRVAARDIDGDGKAEIITSPANTGAARIKILRAADLSTIEDFFGLHVDFRGGAYVG